MIEFTKTELGKIRGDLRNELECSFKGDHTSMDVELAGPEYFDLAPTETALIQRIIAKIAVLFYQRDVVKADVVLRS